MASTSTGLSYGDLSPAFAPRHIDIGYLILSMVIGYIGSLSTLELLQLRTSTRGAYNWFLLGGSSVTMGGIAIWSMHFIGNRAVILYNDEPHLRLSYSPVYTVLSVFVPIFVLFAAYAVCGTGENVAIVWTLVGGFFAGSSIAGMHYLGNAGIANYTCVYNIAYVVGSVIIAIAASSIALTIFFRLQKSFTNGLWKRMIAAVLLTSGCCGMHWTAAMGTKYLPHALTEKKPVARGLMLNLTLIISLIACAGLLAFGVVSGKKRVTMMHRVQKITLVSASFDDDGRLMVLADGTLPTTVITDRFKEKSFEENFGSNHPVFHWIYRTSYAWKTVTALVPAMRQHLFLQNRRLSGTTPAYPVEYSVIFREQFCVAAADLAAATNRPLMDVGVLHTSLLSSGYDPERRGTGRILFLVSRVDKNAANVGFRFAGIDTVLHVLMSSMQVPRAELNAVLSDCQATARAPPAALPPAGIYLACFAARPINPNAKASNSSTASTANTSASYQPTISDLEVVVQPQRPHLLPFVRLQGALLPAHTSWINSKYGATVEHLLGFSRRATSPASKVFHRNSHSSSTLTTEEEFEHRFYKALIELEAQLGGDPFFRQAVLDSSITVLAGGAIRLIILRATPTVTYTPALRFIPMGLFDAMQRDQDSHMRQVHREFSGIALTNAARMKTSASDRASQWMRFGARRKHARGSREILDVDLDEFEQGHRKKDSMSFLTAGIMVSQSISVENSVARFQEPEGGMDGEGRRSSVGDGLRDDDATSKTELREEVKEVDIGVWGQRNVNRRDSMKGGIWSGDDMRIGNSTVAHKEGDIEEETWVMGLARGMLVKKA